MHLKRYIRYTKVEAEYAWETVKSECFAFF